MTFYSRGTSNPRWMARTDLTGSATPSATGSQTRQGLIARLPTGSKSRSGMTVSPLDLRNSAGRSRRNNDSPTPRSPSIPPGNVYKPDRALATQFTISKSNDQPAERALALGLLDSRSPSEGARQIMMHVGENGPASVEVRLEWLMWLRSPQRLGAAWRLGQRLFETFRAQLCKRLARLYSATPASYLQCGRDSLP